MRARRDDGGVHAGVVRDLEILPRSLERAHPRLVEAAHQRLVLAVRQPVHGLGARRIVGIALRQPDPAAREQRADALEARLAVDVLQVVRAAVERHEPAVRPLGAVEDELVEGLRPCGRVHGGAPDQHPVEPEHERRHARRESQEPQRLVRLHEPMQELVAGVLVVRERPEQCRGRLALALEPGRLLAPRRLGEVAPGRAERRLGSVERQPPLGSQQVGADDWLLADVHGSSVLHGAGHGIRSSPPGG